VAKSLLNRIRRHRIIIFIVLVAVFIVIIILGATMGPDKTWRAPVQETTSP